MATCHPRAMAGHFLGGRSLNSWLVRVAKISIIVAMVTVVYEGTLDSSASSVVATPVDITPRQLRAHKELRSSLEARAHGNNDRRLGEAKGEEKDGDEDGDDDDEEMAPDEVALYVSIMLLGAIAFIMALFYLVNHPDADIERYAWKVISATISIFCAVLLFQAFNSIIENYVIDAFADKMGWEHGEELEEKGFEFRIWETFMDLLQLAFWLCMMNLVLAMTSGAVEVLWKPEEAEEVEIPVKSFAVLFAHIAGFAAINGWGSLQQNWLSANPAFSMAVVLIGLAGLFGAYKIMDNIRNYVAFGDDGECDEFEAIWDEESEESENDVAGLSTSFLTCQVIRFWISGDLPDAEGGEEGTEKPNREGEVWKHDFQHWRLLILAGFGFLIGLIVVLRVRSMLPENPEEEEEEEEEEEGDEEESLSEGARKELQEQKEEEFKKYEFTIRALLILVVYFSNGLAWCFFYGTQWAIAHTGVTDKQALLHVYLALVLSFVSFVIIRGLDLIEDSKIMGKQSEKAIDEVIDALGILIGFSWEQSFDVAVDVIADSVENKTHGNVKPPISRLFMSCSLVIIVFPAWKNFILPQELKLKKEATASGAKQKRWEERVKKHADLFVGTEQDEREIDHAHLAMKLHRRQMQGKKSERMRPGLKHLLVTAKGIVEIPQAGKGEKMSAITERLLPECLQEPEEEEPPPSRFARAMSSLRSLSHKSQDETPHENSEIPTSELH